MTLSEHYHYHSPALKRPHQYHLSLHLSFSVLILSFLGTVLQLVNEKRSSVLLRHLLHCQLANKLLHVLSGGGIVV